MALSTSVASGPIIAFVDTQFRLRMVGAVVITAASLLLLTGCAGVSAGSQSSNQPPSQNSGSLAVSPTTLNFGSVAVGNASTLTGTLTASAADVAISSADWSGSGYSVSGITFPVTVPAGGSAKFSVTFNPQVVGSSSGSVTFLSDASNSSLKQSFSGNGTQGQPGLHSVALSWNASTSSVVGYNIYRGTQDGGPYSKVNTSLETATAFTDTTVLSGTTYYYVSTAVDSGNVESAYSNQAVAQIPSQ